MEINYLTTLDGVDWDEIKRKIQEDDFDNGRTAEQLRISFENSYATCIAYDGDQIVGKLRVLSDGVCNAYIVDVWTYHPYRKQGIARKMMETVLGKLRGQHIYLFTDPETVEFYERLGFKRWGIGLGKVEGDWLVHE
jgi:GNAT superfamily N-acetyltransferase